MNTQTIIIVGGVALLITATVSVIALLKAQKNRKDLESFIKTAKENGWIKVETPPTAAAPESATA